MAKITFNEEALTRMVYESVKRVMNEITADSAGKAMRGFSERHGFFSDEYKSLPKVDDAKPGQRVKDKYGNPGTLRHNGRFDKDADRYNRIGKGIGQLRRKEKEQDPIAMKAKSIWDEYALESQLEWGGNEWEGDETYGPTSGYAEAGGWEFNVEGYIDGPEAEPVIDGETVDFTSPEGQHGYFYR